MKHARRTHLWLAATVAGLAAVPNRAAGQDEAETPELATEAERLAAQSDAEGEIVIVGRRAAAAERVVPLDEVGSRDILGPRVLDGTVRRDVNSLVQLLPAASSRPYNGGDASAPSFSVRGLPDDGLTEYLLVEIDGVPASPLPYGWTAFSFLPVTAERIVGMDLIRGAHAVRHSPNTVGGVLDLITDPIPLERTERFSTTFGSNGYRSTLLSAGGTEGGFGALLTYVDKTGDGYRDDGDFRIRDTSLKMRLAGDPGQWIDSEVAYFVDRHQAPGGLTPEQYDDDRFANSRPINHFNGYRTLVSITAHSDFCEKDWVEAFGSYSYTARRLHALPEEGPQNAVDDWEDESKTFIAGVRGLRYVEFLGADHEIYSGLRFQDERIPSWRIVHTPFTSDTGTQVQDRSYRLDAVSAHVDDTLRPIENLKVVLGVRAEWVPVAEGSDEEGTSDFDDSFFAFLPGADASYEISDSWSVYGNAHQSFRAPQVWGFNFSGTDQGLEFEKGESAEIGTRVRPGAGTSGSVALWRVDFDDVATFDKGYYDNFGRIVATGVDVVAAWDAGEVVEALAGFSVQGSWTHQDSRLKEGEFAGNRTPYAWADKGAVSFRYVHRHGWSAAIDATYVGPSWSDEAQSSEDATGFVGRNRSATTCNARIAKVFEIAKDVEAEIAFGVTNLFDTERYVHSRGGFFGGGRVAYAPRELFVSAGLNANF